jgi:2-polyprenyl-3-methyl-5-hydroxy-6-metoxy-1,4-benzoquinol methylase
MNKIQQKVHDWYRDNHSVVSTEASRDARVIGHLLGPNISVLNLGCYRGELEKILGSSVKRWHALDFVQELIDHCNSLKLPGNIYFQRANITDLSFLYTNTYNVILDMSTGDHLQIEDFKLMLKEVYRLLEPEGHFAIAYYNLNFARGPRSGDDNYGYYRKDTPEEMKTMLEDVGFTVIQSEGDIRSYMIGRK